MLLQCRRFDSCGNHSFHPPSHLSRAPPAPKHLKSCIHPPPHRHGCSGRMLELRWCSSARLQATLMHRSVLHTPRTPPLRSITELMGDPPVAEWWLLPRHSCFRLCPAQFWSPWVHESQSQMHGHCDRSHL
jgi:hypothetical protein